MLFRSTLILTVALPTLLGGSALASGPGPDSLLKLKAGRSTCPTIPTRRFRPTRSTLSCLAKGLKISQVPTTTIRSPNKQSSSAGRVRRCGTGRRLGGFVAGVATLPSARHEPASEAAEALACRLDA